MPRQGQGSELPLAVGGKHVAEPDQWLPAIEVDADQDAGDRIGQVVMAARGMVDANPCPLRAVRRSRPASWADKRGRSSNSMRRAFRSGSRS